jgi:uncharacterized membrane protein YhdT
VHKIFADGTTADITSTYRQSAETGQRVLASEKTVTQLNAQDFWSLVLLIFIQVLFVTMVYGPIAAFLVEMFPVRIRYTSMSLPYHVGNGMFGGLMPAVAAYLTSSAKGTGDVPLQADWYVQGLWYPVVIATVCFFIGLIYIDGSDKRIDD